MKKLCECFLGWLSAHWNKRRTSAAERRLAKENAKLAAQIAELQADLERQRDELDVLKRQHDTEKATLKANITVLEAERRDLVGAYEAQMERRRREINLYPADHK